MESGQELTQLCKAYDMTLLFLIFVAHGSAVGYFDRTEFLTRRNIQRNPTQALGYEDINSISLEIP